MQILQWLFKIAAQEPPRIVSNSSPITQKQGDQDENIKSKDIVRRRHLKRVEKSTKLNCDNLSLFCFLQRKDVSQPFFYHTLNLKRLGSSHRRRHSVKTKKDEFARGLGISHDKGDHSASHGGNKVLPISDSAQSASQNDNNNQCSDKKGKTKGDKTKAISRMKELMKWAATARGQKEGKHGTGGKVLNFNNRAALMAATDDDQLSDESPKISFRWDVESCSAVISAVSRASASLKNDQTQSADILNSTTPLHIRRNCADGTGNWITTDSEFVVLEL